MLFEKVQAGCLTAGLGHLGSGGRQAPGRRSDLMIQERMSRREAEAYFSAYVRGRGRGRRPEMWIAFVYVCGLAESVPFIYLRHFNLQYVLSFK